jgi:hypothetical protein
MFILRYETKDTFTDQTLQGMTNGQGFAIEVTENSLVPTLDNVIVFINKPYDRFDSSSSSGDADDEWFYFGGEILNNKSHLPSASIPGSIAFPWEPHNAKNDNVVSNGSPITALNLATKGSNTPKINPIDWSGTGKPRTMTFFVPYNISNSKKMLFDGEDNNIVDGGSLMIMVGRICSMDEMFSNYANGNYDDCIHSSSYSFTCLDYDYENYSCLSEGWKLY